MKRPVIRLVRAAAATAVALASVLAPSSVPAAHAAGVYVPISGAGSTWSYNAVQAWSANVAANGIKVNYAQTGSTDGRNQFRNGTVDFAISEIPYNVPDNGVIDPAPARPYAYMPIVAGGTTFIYHLDSGGKRIDNLRLDGPTLAKIFTGGITMWNDPEIKAENPQVPLPPKKIIPVVRQDGSGTTAQLTTWMASQYPAIWDAYCRSVGRNASPHCGTTSFFPVPASSNFVQATLSTGTTGYVTQPTGEGSIGYVEYSYARNAGFPVVKVRNAADYYVEPTQWNVAVALTKAQINPADLTQKLDGVYTSTDVQTYPLSSYSYMIVPISLDAPMNANKGYTLGDFAYYFLCEGQQHVGDLGYSPLPINLVQAGLNVIQKLPGVNVQNINIAGCHNPTFSTNGTNTLATTAPPPPACAKADPVVQCDNDGVTPIGGSAGTSGGANGGTTGGSSGGTNGGSTGGSSGGTSGGTNGGTTGGTNGGTSGGANGGASSTGGTTGGANGGTSGAATGGANGGATGGATGGGAAIDPDTGKLVTTGGASSGSASGGASGGSNGGSIGGSQAVANPLLIGQGISGTFQKVLMAIAVVLLLTIAIGPPMLSRRLARRKANGGGS